MPIVAAIRSFHPDDSISSITELLHRAYASLSAMGLNYSAVDQSNEQTAQRISLGECAVAHVGERIVGTVTAVGLKLNGGCPWYRERHVASAHQFAVEPEFQGSGIGSALMHWAESWAKDHGFRELAVDTAEPAEQLVAFYSRRGFRFIEFAQWSGKRYRSVILSKLLPSAP